MAPILCIPMPETLPRLSVYEFKGLLQWEASNWTSPTSGFGGSISPPWRCFVSSLSAVGPTLLLGVMRVYSIFKTKDLLFKFWLFLRICHRRPCQQSLPLANLFWFKPLFNIGTVFTPSCSFFLWRGWIWALLTLLVLLACVCACIHDHASKCVYIHIHKYIFKNLSIYFLKSKLLPLQSVDYHEHSWVCSKSLGWLSKLYCWAAALGSEASVLLMLKDFGKRSHCPLPSDNPWISIFQWSH